MDINKSLMHLKDNIISLLFCIVGSEIILYSSQRQFNIIYVLIVAALVGVNYILFQKVLELDKKGPLLYLGVAVLVFIFSSGSIEIASLATETSFYRWFIGGGVTLEKIAFYEYASLIIISFVFSSFSYYFSVTIARMPMMFLISCIALTLNIKGAYKPNSWYIFIFIILLFMLFIVSAKDRDIQKESVIKIDGKYIIYVGSICGGRC